MLSIAYCENILNSKEKKYTKEQIEIIRALLYSLAEIDKSQFLKKHKA